MFNNSLLPDSNDLLIDYTTNSAANKLATHLQRLLPKQTNIPIVFVCIGTDRSTGDSLGPMVGSLLSQKKLPFNYYVYGSLEDPIHALNLEEKLIEIKKLHGQAFIIGIDACLGKLKSVGHVKIGSGPIKPGAAVNKTLPEVGNIHITGTVNVSGFMEYLILQNTRLFVVMEMAKVIVECIYLTSTNRYK